MKKTRLLHIVPRSGGGIREYTAALVEGLAETGLFEIMVLSHPDEHLSGKVEALVEDHITYRDRGTDAATATELFSRVLKIAPARKIDIVHSHGYKSGLVAGPAVKISGKKHIVTIHTVLGGDAGGGVVKSTAQNALALFSDRLIFVSEAVSRSFGAGKTRGPRTSVVYPGVDFSAIGRGEADPLVKKELGLSEDDKIVGCVARLSREKGVDVLLDAAPGILDRVPGAGIVIAGDGPERRRLEAQARSPGIEGKVAFTGFREDLDPVVSLFDVAVCPSRSEAFGLVIIEMLYRGKPTIASNVGGTGEIITDGDTGVLVPPGNPEALADAVAGVLQNPDKYAVMARRGAEFVEQNFSLEKMTGKMVQIYAELAGAKS